MSFPPPNTFRPADTFRPYIPYGPPVPAPAPKIRHPNRPPCTTPGKTLYIRNLNEKTKLPVLTAALQAVFETYGPVLEIRARHSIQMRGQAFIIYESLSSAERAHAEVQGFLLFDKPMFIEYARSASEATVANEGGDLAEFRARRLEEREERAHRVVPEIEVPNKILFLQGLPPNVRVADIEHTFGAHAGFVEVRWVAVKPDVAFVEFVSDAHAGAAKSALGSLWLADEGMVPATVSFARH
ncbi:hypothetical protein IWW56_002594 [Coemansia sp. RSA 2131]|nr:hypothetical protein IWW56_002594 [Coemansia sp. RSA 2131]